MDAGTELLLPESTRLIHIGPHKTGSTAIQVAFAEVRPGLAEHGVLYAGKQRRPRLAGWSIGLPGKRAGTETPPESHWHELVAEVAEAGDQRVVISNEDFAKAGPLQRKRIVEDLGCGRPHVVAVVRRLDTYLPSQWQERVKAGMTRSWEDWLGIVLDLDNEEFHFERRNVWRAHDVGGLLERWSEVVDVDQMTLIVSDDLDRDLLPRTFEKLVGLPVGMLEARPDRSNRSLSWAETEAVRAAHLAFDEAGVTRRGRDPWMADGVLAALRERPRPTDGPSTPPFPAWAVEQLRAISERRARAVRESEVRVVGSPDSLVLRPDLEAGDPAALPPLDQESIAAITTALIRATVHREPGLATGLATAEPESDM